MRLTILLSMAAMVLVPACSPQAATQVSAPAQSEASAPAVHPESGLDVIPLTITTPEGAHRVTVEVARSAQEQAQGLMFRREMGPDEGMLFPRNPPRIASFWMKNTVLPLDIIFIDADGKVINVGADAVPYSTDPVSSTGPAAAVLELNAGRAAELGIGPGTEVAW